MSSQRPAGPRTPAWVRDAVFYQIFPDRFARSARIRQPGPLEAWDSAPTRHGFKGGDLYGIVERLGELQELGITALYLCPIFSSASNHRYHTYDYFNVDPMLGGNDALRELLDLDVAGWSSVAPQLMDTRFDETWLETHPADRAIVELQSSRPIDVVRVLDAIAAERGKPAMIVSDNVLRHPS